MSTNDNLQKVVFIDSRVPDLQDLLAGLAPGEQAFVIDPNSDGLQQIADILTADNLSDISSISIVSHGEAGELELGSALVTDGNLASHAGALAQIGAALAPGGSIQLYGCDVAQGASGQQFINDFSDLAGGAVVDASTHPIGSAALEGGWSLDASSNGATAPASDLPFTTQALAAFSGTLPVNPDGELFYLINNGPNNELGDINSTVATGSTVYTHPTDNETAVAVDTAAGLVFTPGRGIPGTGTYDAVVVHSAKTGATLTTVHFGANNGDPNTDDIVQAVAINPFTDTLYVGDWGLENSTTGIRQFTYNPTTGALTAVATNGGFLFTAAQTDSIPGNDATSRFTNAGAMYLDPAHNLLYYVDDDNGYDFDPFHATNGVYVVSTAGPTFSPIELTSNGSGTGQFPTADQSGAGTFIGAHGNIVGLAVDVAHSTVYFETTDVANSANNALWWVNTTDTHQTATKIALPAGATLNFAGQSNEGSDAAGLTFDPQLRQLYLTNAFETGSDPNNSAIYVLQLDGTGHNVTLVSTLNSTALLGQSPSTVNGFETPSATTFDVLPVLTVVASGTPALQGGAAVNIANSVMATDMDGNHLASATVQITGGTFSTGETSSSDDHLSVNGATTGLIAGTNITVAYNVATETLSLTGYDTIAHYQTVLGEVEYNATGSNATNGGTDPTRTVTWTVSDGATNIPAGSQNSTTSTITITVPTTTPPTANPQSYTTTVGTTLNETDAALGVLAGDADVNHPSLTAVEATGPSNGGLTLNSDGTFTYTPNAAFVGTDSFTYESKDSHGTLSAPATVSINVNDTAPTANDHSYSMAIDTASPPNSNLAGNVLTDSVADPDVNHPTLTASLVSGPADAFAFHLNSVGSFDYAPLLGFHGTDSFTYDSIDSHGTVSSSAGTVSITVGDAANTFDFSHDPNSALNWTINLSANPETAFNSKVGLQTFTGENSVITGSGNNTVIGNNNGDALIGGSGNDVLRGGTGNDVLAAGGGTNVMTGGGGNNTFVFTPGPGPTPSSFTDTITDFHVNADVLDFQGFAGLTTQNLTNQILGDVISAHTASSTVIQMAGNEHITLVGVTYSQLASAHPFELNV